MKTAIIAAAGLVLAACAHMPGVKLTCLPQRTYTAEQRAALAIALQALPTGSPIDEAMLDYAAMRRANEQCRATSAK